MILLALENLYETRKEIRKVDDFRFVISKGTHIVDTKEILIVTILTVSHAVSLRDALEAIWSEIFGRKYSAWIDAGEYIPYGFEDPEDLERVLEEEPETFFNALDPYSGEHFVEKIYRNGKLIYSYDD